MVLPAINIVCDGNSLTYGSYSSTPVTFGSSTTLGSYPSQLQAILTSSFAYVQNLGINGQTTTQMIPRAANAIDTLYNAAYPMNLLIAFEIGNDILLSPYVTPQQAYTNFVNYCLARKAAGWKIAIVTLFSRNGTSTTAGTLGSSFDSVTRVFINNLLRANWSNFSDFLIDVAADSRLSNYSNTTYYSVDGIHLYDAGYNILASYVSTAVNSLYNGYKQLTQKQLIGQLYTPTTMATTAFSSIAISGTAFTVDVTNLGLSSNLSIVDYQVLQGSTDVTNLYTKTSATQLTYAGSNVALGTKVTFYRKTPINNTEVTFISTTTASQLTNALSKLLLRVQELEARQYQLQGQLNQGGITLAPTPVLDQAYGISWLGDTANAPSRNSLYNKLIATDNLISSFAPIASPNFTGVPTAPTAVTSDSSTTLANTALVGAKLLAYAAPLVSAALTGTPTAPTAATTDSSTTIATTAWVKKWTNATGGLRIGGFAIAGNNQVVTPSATGQVIISLTSFTFNGYYSAIVGNGDSGVAKNYVFAIDSTNTSATQLAFYVWNATTNAAVTTATRVAWIYFASYAQPT